MENNVAEKAKDQLMKNAESLHMDRVPKAAKARFKEIALAKFSDDYGATLAHMVEQYDLLGEVLPLLSNHEQRIANLEMLRPDMKQEKDEKLITTVNGKVLHRGGKDGKKPDGQ